MVLSGQPRLLERKYEEVDEKESRSNTSRVGPEILKYVISIYIIYLRT